MDGSTRWVVGILVAVLIVALIAYARGEPRHGEPTAPASVVVISA
jgi:hypothetical protein